MHFQPWEVVGPSPWLWKSMDPLQLYTGIIYNGSTGISMNTMWRNQDLVLWNIGNDESCNIFSLSTLGVLYRDINVILKGWIFLTKEIASAQFCKKNSFDICFMFLLCYKRIYILGMWAVENTFQIVVCKRCVWCWLKWILISTLKSWIIF